MRKMSANMTANYMQKLLLLISTNSLLKPGFHMFGKFQMVWDFTVSQPSQILQTHQNSKSYSRYPLSSLMNRDKSGELGAFLFSSGVPGFCNDRWSFQANEISNLYCQRRWRPLVMDFSHYQSTKLLKCCYISVRVLIFGALPISC